MVSLTAGERLDRIAAYREARRRGGAWLLAQQRRDGSLGDPTTGFSWYRAPWTLSLLGQTEAAVAACAWIRRHLLTADGRIDGPFRVFDDWVTYRTATLAIGAHLAGQYDLSHGLWPGILAVRDPGSGVFADDRLPGPEVRYRDALNLTGGGPGVGFAALVLGDLDAARRIAGFLSRLWDLQPHADAGATGGTASSALLPDRFYHAWSRARQALITEADAEFDPLTMVVDNRLDAPQYWFWGGICAAFLSRLWLADPRPAYLELARRYQAFSMAATEAQFRHLAVCKSGWGAALLWQTTGDEAFLDWTYRMGDWFVAGQEPSGAWPPLVPETPDGIEATLEFTMHLDTILGALRARPDPVV